MTNDVGSTSDTGWRHIDSESGDGILTYRLTSWAKFFDFVETAVFGTSVPGKHRYIWRGQRRSDWSLSSSLDRLFDQLHITASPPELEGKSLQHLESFKYAARGRRGLTPAKLSENEWWALGQHFGLATPLLDWTRSPFAAAYFAYQELATDRTECRIVYGLDQNAVLQQNEELLNGPSLEQGRPPVLEFIDPMVDENQRLVSQDGLFTRAPISTPIEQWIARVFENVEEGVLLRIELPDSDRIGCLRALNRMNINHLSLFPDLSGASRSTNLRLELE